MLDQDTINYLKKLTGNSVSEQSIHKLSSAQKIRFDEWLKENSKNQIENYRDENRTNNLDLLSSHTFENNMILGIGIDIQYIKELFPERPDDLKTDNFATSVFTTREISYAELKKNIYETLGGIFSAKEAIIKASRGVITNMNEIELFWDNQRPSFNNFSLSISHSNGYAIAIALEQSSAQSEDIQDMKNQIESAIEQTEKDILKNKNSTIVILLIAIIGGFIGSVFYNVIINLF